ncbi:hypothetical protein BO82DRAFT_393899 [Aspergillus uvarum CBS 121591]|uniref:GPI anchored protein n=1 Tax=Aspergillus uvarum CBS 121591 TaxID=1448315 RepID=A0A319C2Z2_9EURO|nr:hypothetical protein BO82DRAFT_393899 [Aspergillus uvarum CBS 121591]PYH79484.1 hypothetical protein BO82DRAFT_393899 [Aspergillus uvarum CBS 121591]
MKGLQAGIPLAALAAVARATSVIGGSQGEDRGSDAALPVDNKFRSEVNDYHSDDHSFDLDAKKTIIEPGHGRRPHHHKAREEVIQSNDGVSEGSTYVKPQVHAESNNENSYYEDDHCVELEKDVVEVVPPHGRPKHHHARGQHEDVDVIGGAGGVDTGNSFALPITSKFSSTVNDAYVDDHSRDIDVDTTIVKPKSHPPNHFKARGEHEHVDLIGGAEGIDTGNSFDMPITSTFSSVVNDAYIDDHSRDIDRDTTIVNPKHHGPAHFKARGYLDDVDLIGGPEGVDVGNTFDLPITSKFSSTVNDAYVDDHSRDIDVDKTIVKPHHHKAREGHEHVDVIGGPGGVDTGNTFDLPITSKFSSEVNDYYQDDHSRDIDVDKTVVKPHHYKAQPKHDTPVPAPEPQHEEPKPEEPKAEPHVDETPKQSEPTSSSSCAPTVQEIVRTLTHTLPDEPTVVPKVDAVATEAPAPTQSAPGPSEPTKPTAQSNPTQEVASPTSPFSPNLDEAHHVPGSEPSATDVVQSAMTTAAPAPTEPVVMDKVASSITIQQDSTFHVIPVYVPVSSATTPSSHAVPTAVTSVAGPHSTGVDAYQPTLRYNLPPAAPSASSSGLLFTGAGAPQAAPYAGVFSVLSGLVALLALIL